MKTLNISKELERYLSVAGKVMDFVQYLDEYQPDPFNKDMEIYLEISNFKAKTDINLLREEVQSIKSHYKSLIDLLDETLASSWKNFNDNKIIKLPVYSHSLIT